MGQKPLVPPVPPASWSVRLAHVLFVVLVAGGLVGLAFDLITPAVAMIGVGGLLVGGMAWSMAEYSSRAAYDPFRPPAKQESTVSNPDPETVKRLRDHYDNHSTAAEMGDGHMEFPDRNLDVLRGRTASGLPRKWPTAPLTSDEMAEGESLGVEVPSQERQEEWPNACAAFRQEVARLKAWAYVSPAETERKS